MDENRIQIKGVGRQEEAVAAAALTPGHLLELTSAGKVQKQSTEGGVSERAYALEDALQGKTIDDAYAADDPVSYILAQPGDVVQAFIAAGENVSPGDQLISKGDGTLQAVASASSGSGTIVVAVVVNALDLSTSGAESARTHVRVV